MATSFREAIVGTVGKGIEAVAGFNRSRMKDELDHPFLSGIHRPMEEELTLANLRVDGAIPAALDGSYMRTGPSGCGIRPCRLSGGSRGPSRRRRTSGSRPDRGRKD